MVRGCMRQVRLLDGVVVKLTTWGSRLSAISLIVLIAVLSENCGKGETADGTGGAGLWSPDGGGSGVFCGDQECPESKCIVNVRCAEDGIVCIGDKIAGWDDKNYCTVDTCDDTTGLVTHREYTADEIDDGDECTIDSCDSLGGIMHSDVCGGA